MAIPQAEATWVLEPKQARSSETLDRIVGAARSLLDEMPFGDISIAQIMDRAGMSVGSFYTRFPNKAALLPYLYERYDAELQRTSGSLLRPESWTPLTLAERIRRMVEISVAAYRANKGLWRAILIHAASDPAIVTESYRRRRTDMVQRIAGLLLERRGEMTHPDPKRGVEFCVVLLFATCKDQILLEERSLGTDPMSDERLAAELARTLCAYLGVREAPAGPVPSAP